MNRYDEAFFSTFQDSSRASAEVILPPLLSRMNVESVIDVGCGLGIWLDVARSHGVAHVLGIDGGVVHPSSRLVKGDEFKFADLANITQLASEGGRSFDLAICLEVAEHLPESSAAGLVDFLCTRSRVVLFGAAIPFQGGTGHQNEQWPDYWARMFEDQGYRAVDEVRLTTWDNAEVSWWYSQNVMLYVEREYAAELGYGEDDLLTASQVRRFIHPEMYLRHADPRRYTSKRALGLLTRSLRSSVERRLGG